jgi:uncharacterized membrane protein YdjX (TVP38/TMEM64 family)
LQEDTHGRRRSLVPLLVPLAAALAAIALAVRFGVDMDDVRAAAARGHALAATHPSSVAGALLAAIFVCGVFSIPLKGLLSLVAGALLGPAAALAVVLAGILAGATVLFRFTRRFLRRRVEERMGGLARRVEARLSRRPILAVAGLRLMIALPYGPITMAAAVTSIRYRDFLIGSLLGDLPVIALYAFAGERLATLASAADAISPVTAAILIGIGALLVAGSLWGKRSLKG